MTFGAVYGVPIGARFTDRRSLYDAAVHRDIRRSICGGHDGHRGAESVLIADGHEDVRDLGQIVYFTGVGQRDGRGRPTADQEFSGLNGLLATNAQTAQPVRCVRAVAGEYEYAGLAVVEDAFTRLSTTGFCICQFRLRLLNPDPNLPVASPGRRVLTTHYQLVRDPSVPSRVKALYDYTCQVCRIRIDTLAGPYSEGAHLVPLGGGADGPDIEENVLSLCPNHHVMLDHGAICITDDWMVTDRSGRVVASLTVHPDHHLNRSYAQAHRLLMGFTQP